MALCFGTHRRCCRFPINERPIQGFHLREKLDAPCPSDYKV